MAIVATAAVIVVRPLREPILRAAGSALVANGPLSPADIIDISLDSAGAGALEAADLLQAGIATRVAVFADPPNRADREFIRRGLDYEDQGARQVRQLRSLGVTDIVRIPRDDAGTGGEGEALPSWCAEQQIRSLVFVSAKDHSRRVQRVLARSMRDSAIRVSVQPERHSGFEPHRWWETREGARTAIIEFQKLALDFLLHPLSP